MSVSLVHSRALHGARAIAVRVEVHIASGLPGFSIVGLPDTEVRESRERVRSALQNSGFEFPARRITVNLAPADLPKGSGRFDLPLAIGIAAASGQLPGAHLPDWEFSGELSLTGEILNSPGALALALSLRRASPDPTRRLMLGPLDAQEAACVEGLTVYGAPTLLAACAHLVGHGPPLAPASYRPPAGKPGSPLCFSEVRGQAAAKRALEIAACGGHNVLMVGPPGSGKSMLAHRFPGLLPPPDITESLESAALRSLRGLPLQLGQRPFESPHHSASLAAVVGGGNPPQPGAITLAHHGVLFLDEALEFDRRCLEALREPLETGEVHIARVGHQVSYPAGFQWLVAHNPCPCGWLGHASHRCRCSDLQIQRYRSKLSGPLLDRIDMGVEVSSMAQADLLTDEAAEPSSCVAARVLKVRQTQMARQGCLNSRMSVQALQSHCVLDARQQQWLARAADKLQLTGRSTHRVLRVARSIADMAGQTEIQQQHLAEALTLRQVINR